MKKIKRMGLAMIMLLVVFSQVDLRSKKVVAYAVEPNYSLATLTSYGSGTQADPWRIYYLKQFAELALINDVDNHDYRNDYFILMNDLDFADANNDGSKTDAFVATNALGSGNWVPIGTSSNYRGFTGNFNGKGHTISNLKIDAPAQDYVGLFSHVFGGGSITNLHLANVDVKGNNQVGGISGLFYAGGWTDNVSVSGKVSGNWGVGGISGQIQSTIKLSNVYNTADITGSASSVGGIAGYAYSVNGHTSITNAYNFGSITMTGEDNGNFAVGILGTAAGSSESGQIVLSNVYNKGLVSGVATKGNLVGKNWYYLTITNGFYPEGGLDPIGNNAGTMYLTNVGTYSDINTMLESLNEWVNDHQTNPATIFPWRLGSGDSEGLPVFNDVILCSTGSTAYTASGVGVIVDASIQVLATSLKKVVIKIDDYKTGDSLSYVDANGITGSYSAGTLELSSTSLKLGSDYQTALRSVKFSTTGEISDRTISFTINNGTSDISSTKTMALSGFKVTYSGNGNTAGSVPSDSAMYWSGTSVTLLGNSGDLEKTGYTFVGWSYDGTSYDVSDTFEITEDTTLVARWAIVQYTVTFVDYDLTELSSQEVDSGSAATAPDNPTRVGYQFKGWDKSFDEITEDLTVTATYEEIHTSVEGTGDSLDIKVEGLRDAVDFTKEELNPIQGISIQLQIYIMTLEELSAPVLEEINKFEKDLLDNGVYTTLFMDIQLFKNIDEGHFSVSETSSMVKISFIVPENLRGKEFKLIRIHTEEGITTTSTLEYTYDSESFVLSFETDQFSIFGLVSASAKLPNTGESHTTEAFIILMSLVGLLLTLKRKLN